MDADRLASAGQVRLFEADPDLPRLLGEEERETLKRLRLPLLILDRGDVKLDEVLASRRAFAAIVLDGLASERLVVGGHAGLRLIGPGDVVCPTLQPRSMLLASPPPRILASLRLALLGEEMEVACRHVRGLIPALSARIAAQADRQAVQLVICQIPRVEERLMAMMWLLAESWGKVTPSGTFLPLELRHEALGGLIGARRPTVTLALGELAARGALVRQDRGWRLLEGPPLPSSPDAEGDKLSYLTQTAGGREQPERLSFDPGPLMARVAGLHADHAQHRRDSAEAMVRSREPRRRARARPQPS